MKETDRDRLLNSLPQNNTKTGLDALNRLLSAGKNVNNNIRHQCLIFFIAAGITEVVLIDNLRLDKIAATRKGGKTNSEVIPHSGMTEDFIDVLINTKESSEKKSFFGYVRKQLLLFYEGREVSDTEEVLRQMGLKIISFSGTL